MFKSMKNLWGLILRHLAKWRRRLGSVKEMRVDGFEIFDFSLMLVLFVFFCTSWFTGPYTTALKDTLPSWLWASVTGALGLLTAWGFLEENYAARRFSSGLAALFLWSLGVASAVVFPHWLIGYLFCLISPVPAWLCSQFAVYQIQLAHRAVPGVCTEMIPVGFPAKEDYPIVKMPRRV